MPRLRRFLLVQTLLVTVPLLALPGLALAGSCCSCALEGKATCLQDPPGGDCTGLASGANPDLKGATCRDIDPAQCKPVAQGGLCAAGPQLAAEYKKGASTSTPAAGFVIHITAPVLNVPIPGLQFPSDRDVALTPGGKVSTPFLAQYIAAVYRYLIGISVVAASVMIVYGGFLYVLGSTFTSISRGKEVITDAVIGVIILFGLVTILDTVNANIVDSLNHPLEIFAIQKLEKPIALMEPNSYLKAVSGSDASGGGGLPVKGGAVDFNTEDCQFPLQTQGKYAGTPTSKSVYECGVKLAAKSGVHPCFAVVALNRESGGLSNAWGNDANAGLVGNVIPQARLNFLRSGKKFSGATFNPPPGLPGDCGGANGELCRQIIKQTMDIRNDDGPPDPSKPEWGLDWRPGFSHGIGPKQTTLWKPFCKGDIPSRTVGGKCYTIGELLLPGPALASGLQLMKGAGADMNPTQESALKVWVAYAGGPGGEPDTRTRMVMDCMRNNPDDAMKSRIGGLGQYDK